jgi:dynein heavy chain
MGDDEKSSAGMVMDALKKRLASAFPKLVGNKLDKALVLEENAEMMRVFVEDPATRALVVPQDLKFDHVIPSKLGKGKVLLFVKLDNVALDSSNNNSQMICTEIGGSSPFEHLELLANEVFLPVLSNQQNQARWGEVPTREIMDKFHNFLSSTTIICGQIKGETRLPMPPIDLSGGPSTGKNKISLLEGAIITWTKQIRSVLKLDPEFQLKQGLHPTPDVEIEFWKNKAANLNSIFEQLQGPRIRRVLRALDQSKSTYCTTFARLCREVFTTRMEANDNTKYLRTLEEWFQRMSGEDDFPRTVEHFKPMLHIILLIWKNSKHYNTPARLVVLMREICNSLIGQATKYVSGEQIFGMIAAEEANQAVSMLKTTLHVCGAFKATYFDYRQTANAECPANQWKIQNNALFMRLDSFLERCHDILDLTQTIVQFAKLAKIEVGGTKGKTLTASIKHIYDDFNTAVDKFKVVEYDIMDVGAKAFDDDFYEFRGAIKELERRLGAVVSLAFDDCSTVYGRFKLLDSFEGLLERPIIQDELEKKYVSLVQSYGMDLKTVQELFLQYRDDCPIFQNMPPIAGALTWCRGLVDRIQIPMTKLQQLDRSITEREEAKEVLKVYKTIVQLLQEFENQKIDEWSRDVEQSSQSKLKLPLLVRNPDTRLLGVNFDPALVRLLREVKYFLLLGLAVPESALEIYKQVETFRRWTGNLDLIVNMNNDVLSAVLPVEKPLVMPYLTKFDFAVEKGLTVLNWKSANITEFIGDVMESVKVVSSVNQTMKHNFEYVQQTINSYNKPLLARKPKPVVKEEFDREHKNMIKERYAEIKDGGKHIHNMVKETNKVLRVSNASADWRAYVDFINNVVVSGLANCVNSSLEYLLDQIDPAVIAKEEKNPMVEIKLELVNARGDDDVRREEVRFLPDLMEADGKGVRDLVNTWIGSFLNVATVFRRLDNEGTYLREMHTDQGVCILLAVINETLQNNEDKCVELKKSYEDYSYLWETDITKAFEAFKADAVIITENKQSLLDLDRYAAEIKKYESVRDTISKLPSPMDIGWLRVNTQPIKSQLTTWASKWVSVFMEHLHFTVVDKLGTLHTFMGQVSQGLDREVLEDGSSGEEPLRMVMEDIRDVRMAVEVTNEMFEPLQKAINLIKAHQNSSQVSKEHDIFLVKIGDKNVQDCLDEAPMAWESVVKKTFGKKEEIMPIQMKEVEKLKENLEAFFLQMRTFRNTFRKEAPFTFDGSPDAAYKSLDTHAKELITKEVESKRYNDAEELFELQVSKYPETGDTRMEIKLLKYVWDMKSLVMSTFESWNELAWHDIDTDKLEDVSKLLMKNLKKMANDHPIVKGWLVYRSIEDIIKDMNIILPLVNSLHSESMRDRHWKDVAKICCVKTVDPSDPKFTFENVVKLGVHRHADDLEEVVELSFKELKIERKLKDIELVWRDLEMDYTPYGDSEMSLIKPSEDVIENLEAHQLELQTMIGMGKFVDFFRDRVLGWQTTLGTVEDVIKVWINVSRSWNSLESIFLASADIRAQLPDDTKRFEGLDSEFKELMKEAVEEPNCAAVCTVEGRQDILLSLMQRLELCQKSLNEYLDQKKKIFPRFYFVSNVALLDMLANGTNPAKIMKYIGDCFDALNELIFVIDEKTQQPSTTTVDRMIAKDGEELDMSEPFELTGEVEGYLNRLTDAMRATLRLKLAESYNAAGLWELEKPRHEWLFHFPAQAVVTITQIFWTEETEASLEELSGGQEDAVKRYLATCDQRLQELIKLVLGKLEPADRIKIITVITLDVHARDVIQYLINSKVDGMEAFAWQQQLRFYWKPQTNDCEIRICDFKTIYFYEWVGNTGRLVITPLTDRCYVTLSMGLRLFLGGAPAGPAGTGKTETTKDLARALALPCYVFNCSDQMNYQTMADIFRGLAQVGCWGCFDEFNRISIEVLSVVAAQVKSVQDKVKEYAVVSNRAPEYQHLPAGCCPAVVGEFVFEGDNITLIPTVGFFITMNPGYAGRTELPENLKALFRSCAMIRPDLKLICENMLMSEGFQGARTLSVKFVTLYSLSSELLSKQAHYDWGLRAVKSVLRVAGALKRGEPEKSEDTLLMRALRDFNTPKIPAQDTPIFLRLIADLFMGLDAQLQVNNELKVIVEKVTREENLQVDETFVLKVLQFQELLDVRHSVMLLGPTGCGKTTIWKTLVNAHNWDVEKDAYKPKRTCIYEHVNPKSVNGDELYGYMTLAKDWKDGVLSIIMRGMSKNVAELGYSTLQTYKWVILDGDIDAIWIESMNTVMDDNKVLTLVSNERIPLNKSMRMVFEINSLRNATPATVSRAGILFINETDVGWRPYVDSWLLKRDLAGIDPSGVEKQCLPGLFDKYIEATVEMTRKGFKECTPIYLLSKVACVVSLLEANLDSLAFDKKTPEVLENIFCYSLMWAFGGPMINDKSGNFRHKFSEDFASVFGQRFPKEMDCFDYFYDVESDSWLDWAGRVPKYTPIPIGGGAGETPFADLFVSTSDSVRLTSILNSLARKGKYGMLVGSGSGKTALMSEYLNSLDKDTDGFFTITVNMSYYTDAARLQAEIELPIDKRSGRRYGPPATKRLIVFIDDMNLPYIETYGTQNAIALLTQHMTNGTIFDRQDLGLRKEIVDVQYMAAMNPTAGSFTICERAQRLFATFACLMPSEADLTQIFNSLFMGHVSHFNDKVVNSVEKIVAASLDLYQHVSNKFLPSAVRFTYNWSLREITNVFQGMCTIDNNNYETEESIVRVWIHEFSRVVSDRFFFLNELEVYNGLLGDALKKHFSVKPEEYIGAKEQCYTTFVKSQDPNGPYVPCESMEQLRAKVDAKLEEYNETFAIMDLVLFDQAAQHITRISRIVKSPGGNAMLIGVGGSGKQSLSRLAAFISGMEVKQLQVTSSFKVDDLLEAFKTMFIQAGVKGIPIMFLMTDSQVVNDRFLVYINAILSSGWISGLYAKDEIDGIMGNLRNEAKASGVPDMPDAMLAFFIMRIRTNFHIVLCFSPVGDTFRIRARRFPALIMNTAIDFFHPWPRDALISVADKFLDEVEFPAESADQIRENLAIHMADEHLSVTDASARYLASQTRYNYVTPKSFLELISFYKHLLGHKRTDVMRLIDRLDVGLSTLRKTAADVAELQVDLAHRMEKVAEKKIATDALIVEIGIQRADADVQNAKAAIEKEAAEKASGEAEVIEKEAEGELAQAKPAMLAAADAVDCLSKGMLTELKSLGTPPSGVDLVTTCVLILIEREYKNFKWDRAKKMMANVDAFKARLQQYRGEDMTEDEVKKIEPYLANEMFSVKVMEGKSMAAANLANWVINIHKFNRIYVKVKPLMDALEAARSAKAAALSSLAAAEAVVAACDAKLKALGEQFEEATEEKRVVEEQAAAGQFRLGMAHRLVGGLSSENERWGTEIEHLKNSSTTMIGDCMLAAGFVSYVGAFDEEYRANLWKDTWLPDLVAKNIPLSPEIDPLDVLTTGGKNAQMMSEGLPADRISIENGSIISACKRWPLLIDPQTQAIKWLRNKEANNGLQVFQLNQKGWIRKVEQAVQNGNCVIIENLGSDIDATMDPVLSRAIIKKGRNYYIRFAGEEIEYDVNFKLYLQTKLSNPHYKPEIAAQCTLINFIATERGLEDQLLAKVVGAEKPELEAKAQELQAAFQMYKIQLVELEDSLLEKLANAPEDILSDVALIEGLEATKKAAGEIAVAVEEGKKTEIEINLAREGYRVVANEGAMLYFLMTKLCSIEHMYQYSLDSFVTYFYKSIERSPQSDDQAVRMRNLQATLRLVVFTMVNRGLFVRHKLIFLAQLTFNLMKKGNLGEDNLLNNDHFQFLLRGPRKATDEAPNLPWLPVSAWQACNALADLEEFGKFPSDLVEAAPRFREWFNHITPETEKLPLDWAGLDRTPMQKMMVVRCLRPDRLATSLVNFIRSVLPDGNAYADSDSALGSVEILDASIADSDPATPIYVILSPGANVMADLDKLAAKYNYVSYDSYHNVAMGQGQDVIAMRILEAAHRQGHWVVLNNVHLMPRWLVELEKKLDEFALEGSHKRFRLFLSSDAANSIPIGLLNRCIKLTNEPPAGLKANIKRGFASLNRETFEEYDSKMKAILFGLCHFHAVMLERKMYGPMGYNMMYPFSIGDLRDSSVLLANYMENSGGGKIPWADLKYLFGEIMYGGHIVNDFDRLVCTTYLDFFMKDELLDETELYPFNDEPSLSFSSPAPTTFEKYIEHVDTALTQDTPVAFGLHPNAEIDFRTTMSNRICATLLELQPRVVAGGEGAVSPDEISQNITNDILDKLLEKGFDTEDLSRTLGEEQGPYQNVFIQEMDVHNNLLGEIIRSLKELLLGFAGELTMSDAMDTLKGSMYLDRIPPLWNKRAWPSLRSLQSWLIDFMQRLTQLEDWQNNPMEIPRCTWISGLVNPQSFLTAICQVTAQKNQWELDKLVTWTDITKKESVDQVEGLSRDGAYIIGLSMQGARWDQQGGVLERSRPKEMFCKMPVINVRGVAADKADTSAAFFKCPCYKTEQRGPTYVFEANIKTKVSPAKWVLAGVALIMDVI